MPYFCAAALTMNSSIGAGIQEFGNSGGINK